MQNIKQTIVLNIIIAIFLISAICITNTQTHIRYKQEFIHQEQQLISGILKSHPELKEELITILLGETKNIEIGQEFFKTYGIDLESYDNIGAIYQLKQYSLQKWMLLFVVILSLFLFVVIRYHYYQQKEINQIIQYLNHVLSGDYSLTIHEYEEGKISTLKNDIYKMTMLLKEQDAYSKNEKKYLESVLSDISHQLKTPLTSMYVINDILENDKIDDQKKKEMLHKNKNQLKRIEWLVSSLLKLSRLDSGVVIMKPQPVLAITLIQQALEPLKIPIELKEQTIDIIGDEKVKVDVDFLWTVEALVNIIKNSHEHTKKGGTIQIHYTDNPLYVEFQIQDNGEGISKEDLPHIFERFYKGAGDKDSIGIGLHMASTIIQKQNGIISVKSMPKKGTIFIIKFYKSII